MTRARLVDARVPVPSCARPPSTTRAEAGAPQRRHDMPGLPATTRELLRGQAGEPLDAATRRLMEPRFGVDFARVRVHANARAAASAEALHARAYTVGQHLVFAAREFAPSTDRGRALIAHELAHTVQQRAAGHLRTSALADDVAEASAEAAGHAAANGLAVTQPLGASGIGVSRQVASASGFGDEELARKLADVTERLKQAAYPERSSDEAWLPMLQAEAARRARLKGPALPARPVAPRQPPADPARERAEAVAAAEAQIARMTAEEKDDEDTPAAPADKAGATPARQRFAPAGFTDADIYRDGVTGASIGNASGPVRGDDRPYKTRLEAVRQEAPYTTLPADFARSAYQYGRSAGMLSDEEEAIALEDLGAPLRERQLAEAKVIRIQTAYQQQLRYENFLSDMNVNMIGAFASAPGKGALAVVSRLLAMPQRAATIAQGINVGRAVAHGDTSGVADYAVSALPMLYFHALTRSGGAPRLRGAAEEPAPRPRPTAETPVSAIAEEVSPAQVRKAYAANPDRVNHSGSDAWHQQQWEANGGTGPAPIAFRYGGMIRVNEGRWLAVGELSEINSPQALAPSRVVPEAPPAKVVSPQAFARTGAAVDPLGRTGAAVDPLGRTGDAPAAGPRDTQHTPAPVRPMAPAGPAGRFQARPAVPAGPRGPTPVAPEVVVEAHRINPQAIVPSYSSEFHAQVWRSNHGSGAEVPLAYRIGAKIRVDVERLPADVRTAIGYGMML